MTATNRRETNARNAQRSTGPKTPEGKATIRLNALKHGLLSQDILLPDEDGKALAKLGEEPENRPAASWRSGVTPR
jgi:hypothetical protein